MKYHKLCLMTIVSLMAAIGGLALPHGKADKSGRESVANNDEGRIRFSTRADPEGQWLTLVPWEELKGEPRFDEVLPFYTPSRVLMIKDGKCALVSRKTWLDRVNAEIEAAE
jgi:hypothetical protein